MRLSQRWLHARGFAAISAAVPAVIGPTGTKVGQIYQKCLDPLVPPSDLVRLSTNLLPFIADGSLQLRQQVQLLDALAARSVRNEGVIQKCLWDIFKAPLPACTAVTGTTDGSPSAMELAAYTCRAFRLMAEQQFLNDPQMTTIALGRCVELATYLTLSGVCDAYKGLCSVNHMFFSTTEAAHQDSGLTENMAVKEFYEKEDAPDAETLRNQPNLIDVLCGELEVQLQRCVCAFGAAGGSLAKGDDREFVPLLMDAALSSPTPSIPSSARAGLGEPQCFLDVLDSLAVVGVQRASTLDCFTYLVPRYRSTTASGFFIHALHHATQIRERVVDPLLCEESADVRDARRRLALQLSEEVHRMPGAANYLRHHPSECLLLRRLFEREAANASLSPALWDTVRTIRVAHRHAVGDSQRRTRPTGKLFDKKYAVKVKPVSVDNSEAERFVPPEFKTWRSPAATPRGGHPRNRQPPRRMAFGTRRISKNYIRDKRKKFCPVVL